MELIINLLVLLITALHGCHGDPVIKRQKSNNTVTDTIVYNSTSKMVCMSSGQVILWKEDRYQCVNQTRISDAVENENCTYETSVVATICKLDGPFAVRNIDDKIWTDRNISCISLEDTNGAKVLKNTCGLEVPISGILIKMNYKCSNDLTLCTIFTLPGKVAQTMPTTVKPKENSTLTASPTQVTVNATTTMQPVANQTTLATNRTALPPTAKNTTLATESTNATPIIVIKQTTGVVSMTSKTPLVTLTTVATTTVVMEEDGLTTKKMVLYIVVPIVSIIFIIICCVLIICCCCRKRCKYKRRNTLQLFKISSGDTDDDVEGLYAKPQKQYSKKKKRKQKKTKDVEISTRPAWKDYDEVGVVIEGTYEKRESLLVDENSKYGVSAMLLSDENPAPDNKADEDDPYEQLGRNNSFTPKTFVGQKLAKIDAGRNQTQQDETSFDNAENEANNDNTPYLGNTNSPMQMSSFKPGSSIRKKQQRTSMKKPKSDKDNSSETHEDVTITPQPSKKNLAVLSSSAEESSNLLSPHTASTGGSYDLIPSDVEPDDFPKQNGVFNNEKSSSNPPAKYADIEFATKKNNGAAVHDNSQADEVGNYTDVIISDD